jgi:hypothetical protein
MGPVTFQLKFGRTSAPRLPHAPADEPRLDIGEPQIIAPPVGEETVEKPSMLWQLANYPT